MPTVAHVFCSCSTPKAALIKRKQFLAVRNGFTVAENENQGSAEPEEPQDVVKKADKWQGKADCFALLRRITKLKVSIQ